MSKAEMEKQERRGRSEGYEAYLNGVAFSGIPYPQKSRMYEAWAQGWLNAQLDF